MSKLIWDWVGGIMGPMGNEIIVVCSKDMQHIIKTVYSRLFQQIEAALVVK